MSEYYTAGKPTKYFVEGLGYITEEKKLEIEKENQRLFAEFEKSDYDFSILENVKFIIVNNNIQ